MPRPRSEKARQLVLDAMRAVVAEAGFESVTIEGLAETAGVSKQTIYRWWPSKAAILGEALLDGELPGGDLEVPFTASLSDDLRTWFRAVSVALGHTEGAAVARALIAVTATDAELGRHLNERLAAPIRKWVLHRLRTAVEEGEVRADAHAGLVADQFIAIASYAALLGQPLDARQIDETVDVMMRGLSAN